MFQGAQLAWIVGEGAGSRKGARCRNEQGPGCDDLDVMLRRLQIPEDCWKGLEYLKRIFLF